MHEHRPGIESIHHSTERSKIRCCGSLKIHRNMGVGHTEAGTSLLALRGAQMILLQQPRKKSLRQILRITRRTPVTPRIPVKRRPIHPAQLFQRSRRLPLTAALRLQHKGPARRAKEGGFLGSVGHSFPPLIRKPRRLLRVLDTRCEFRNYNTCHFRDHSRDALASSTVAPSIRVELMHQRMIALGPAPLSFHRSQPIPPPLDRCHNHNR